MSVVSGGRGEKGSGGGSILDLASNIQFVKGVGPKRAEYLEKLGIRTVEDALYHFPIRYEDRSHTPPIAKLQPDMLATVTGRVQGMREVRRGRRTVFELTVADETGYLRGVWFNYNPRYLSEKLKGGESLVLSGRVSLNPYSRKLEMVHPDWEPLDPEDTSSLHMGRIVPVYPLTEGLTVKFVRSLLDGVLPFANALPDPVPRGILDRYRLPEIGEAVRALHFPPPGSDVDLLNRFQSVHHKRMIFEELFVIQVGLALKRRRYRREIQGIACPVDSDYLSSLKALLPFELTGAQTRVLSEILSDLGQTRPMNRLLQGDVGSGKTVVALATALAVIGCGFQAAVMVPTEILAEQHHRNFKKILGEQWPGIGCVTSSSKNKKEIADGLASGEIRLIIGTHALIQEEVRFHRLGLAVIDEQHRFGVVQRASLIQKGMNCHTLVMTATPIPRTLAMTLYGDLDVSVIDELPKGRKPIHTEIFYENRRRKAYDLVEREVRSGRQVYFVYPLVEESEKLDLKAATEMMEHLKTDVFPHLRLGLLHGRMNGAEKESVMARYKGREIDVLVTTSVVEVGVDVGNATVMAIEHAERFGLSQLHQLRGRVGRGDQDSYCILLVGPDPNETAKARLAALKETGDGFRVAERDLEIRGSGDFFGTKQSGLPELRIADLIRDHKILLKAREEAFALVQKDPHLLDPKNTVLRDILKSRWREKFELGEIA